MLIIAPDQKAYYGYLFDILKHEGILCVLIRIALRGNSNEYRQNTIVNIKKKITLNYPKSAAMGLCSKELKNMFETVVVNEPSVFKPLKFYYTMFAFIICSRYKQVCHFLKLCLEVFSSILKFRCMFTELILKIQS